MRIIFYVIWLLLLAVFQPTLARGIELWGIAPNLFLCFVVMAGFFRGKYEGAVCGMVFGLVGCAVAQIMKTSLNFAFIGILVSAVAMVIVSAATKKKGTIVADAE